MAKSVVLIAPAVVTLPRISGILNERWPGGSEYLSSERPQAHVQVSDGGTWYVTFSELTPPDEVRADYEDNEEIPEAIRTRLDGKRFYAVSFNEYTFCGVVVRHTLSRLIGEHQDIWLDNDYGILIPANRVLAEFDKDPNWDWRGYRPGQE